VGPDKGCGDGAGGYDGDVTTFGYTLMTEQSGPKDLVRWAVRAEAIGFDFEVCSDHYSPWLTEQGHAPYAWSVLGAVAQATERVELMTYVTCPTMRYHPAVVAQKSATIQLLADGRFTLGLGSGESLNEHVVADGWPGVHTRHEMLVEAIEIIRQLHSGELVTHHGDYFDVDSARIWDLPDILVPVAVAVSGDASIERLAPLADHMIAVEPEAGLIETWNHTEGAERIGAGARAIGQIPICWDADEESAVRRAHEQFRWFGGGWAVNADLPTPAGFAAATQFVRPEDVAAAIPCGPDLDSIVEAVRAHWEAGFTDIALLQIGGEAQDRFLDEAAVPLLEKLRAAAG
jgi:G6PDH family F420-dependent oxidoreductase